MGARIEPREVVAAVEAYVSSELSDASRYTNRSLLDESGVWSLHRLAADVYALGWEAGERAQAERDNQQRRRDRERAVGDGSNEGAAG